MTEGLVEGRVYRWKPNREMILFKRYIKGAPFPYLFIDIKSGDAFALCYTELRHITPTGSAKLVKMDKRIV